MYDHKKIEGKWSAEWAKNNIYKTNENAKEKEYVLSMFPYPSGYGLHVGHARVYIASDIYVRMRRMQGKGVLFPMGWDAFGLPAENYAIENKKHPKESTEENINNFKKQLNVLGLSLDWEREITTSDPSYYKWTQWIFLKLYEKGLAYQSHEPINWCPSCQTGLANEDLEGGKCERCGAEIERKPMRQWVLRITDYADKLLEGLEELDGWADWLKLLQKNWIGRREGYEIPFETSLGDIKVFTTRPDTLYGATFIALSPESKYIYEWKDKLENKNEIDKYVIDAFSRRTEERGEDQEKTGVLLEGVSAYHPITKKEIPVYVTDYVQGGYGTGAIFGCPAHDTRDFAFAKKFSIEIIQVIEGDELPHTKEGGVLMNSGEFDGMNSEEAKLKLTEKAGGSKAVVYKLQDWVFSRQRYWGEPIPLIHKGEKVIPSKDLPVQLPDVENYQPTGTGESPLANIEDWVNVDGGKRETNTMPQWAGSCWYYLRFIDSKNDSVFVDKKKEKEWMPVDMYIGGAEHATRHLIYARFWHKVLYDIGEVSTSEPFKSLHSVGVVHAEDGRKMSKRYGNVIDPIEVCEKVGADSVRMYIAFIAPFGQSVSWDSRSVTGPRKYLDRVYNLKEKIRDIEPNENIKRIENKTIIKVTENIDKFRLNTPVSYLMTFLNELMKEDQIPRSTYENLIKLTAPFAPFITEQIWSELGHENSIHLERWPIGDSKFVKENEYTIVVQVDGKIRGELKTNKILDEKEVLSEIDKNESIKRHIANNCEIKAYIPNKLISFSSK